MVRMNRPPVTTRLIRIALIGLATIIFLFATTPATVPAMLLVAPFIGMFGFLYLVIMEIAYFIGPDDDENGAIVRLRRPRVMAALAAGFPVLLLALQSVVELTHWDIVIACAILVLAYLYAARGSVGWR